MRYALAFHPDQIRSLPDGWKCLMVPPSEIEEARLPAAVEQGWIVIGNTESEIFAEPIPEREPVMDMKKLRDCQSNPRRPQHGYGHTEDDAA